MNTACRPSPWFYHWLALALLAMQAVAQPALAEVESTRSIESQEQRVAEARRAYQRALRQFDSGKFRAALAGFRQAYELAPSFHILYNTAVVNLALDDAVAAQEAFERYLQEGGDEVPRSRRAEVERELTALAGRIASLEIRVNRANARIWIDERDIGETPLTEPIRLNPGKYHVSVRDESGMAEERLVQLQAGEERMLTFQLDRQDHQSSQEDHPSTFAPPWLAWGVTGALAVSAGVVGATALRASADERTLQKQQGVTAVELREARKDVRGWSRATDVLLAATAVGFGVSLYLTLRSGEGQSDTALVVGPGSLAARYQF